MYSYQPLCEAPVVDKICEVPALHRAYSVIKSIDGEVPCISLKDTPGTPLPISLSWLDCPHKEI